MASAWIAGYLVAPSSSPATSVSYQTVPGLYTSSALQVFTSTFLAQSNTTQSGVKTATVYDTITYTTSATGLTSTITLCSSVEYTTVTTTGTMTSYLSNETVVTKTTTTGVTTTHAGSTVTTLGCDVATVTRTTTTYVTTTQ